MSDVAEPFSLPIERGKIREFARAIHSRNPAYLEAEDAVIPPTFLISQLHWQVAAARPPMPKGANVLHGEQEYEFFGVPPRAGDRLIAQSRTEPSTVKEGRRGGTMTFTDIITEYRDEDGRLVARSRMTLIETSRPPKATEAAS